MDLVYTLVWSALGYITGLILRYLIIRNIKPQK